MIRLYLLILFCFSFSNSAFAYLGPGVGGGVIAATIGIIVCNFLQHSLINMVPVKRLLKKRKKKKDQQQNKSWLITYY